MDSQIVSKRLDKDLGNVKVDGTTVLCLPGREPYVESGILDQKCPTEFEFCKIALSDWSCCQQGDDKPVAHQDRPTYVVPPVIPSNIPAASN
jgi:hypothetical protein